MAGRHPEASAADDFTDTEPTTASPQRGRTRYAARRGNASARAAIEAAREADNVTFRDN